MRDAHQMVIHHVREIVGRIAVRLDQNHIVHLTVLHRDVSVVDVMERRGSLRRHVEADHMRHAGGQLLLNLLLRQMETVLVIGRIFLPVDHGLQTFEPFLRAEAVVGVPLSYQLLGVFPVNPRLHPLGLHIGPDASVPVRTFVIVKARFLQRAVDDIHRALHIALLIGVLDPKHENAPGMPGNQIRIQSRAKISHMHLPRGTGCKSGLNHISHIISEAHRGAFRESQGPRYDPIHPPLHLSAESGFPQSI